MFQNQRIALRLVTVASIMMMKKNCHFNISYLVYMKTTISQLFAAASMLLLAAACTDTATVEVDFSQIHEPFGAKYIHTREGVDVRTTCDTLIQNIADDALRSYLDTIPEMEAGTAVVMDVATGAVRAMVSLTRTDDGRYDRSFNYAAAKATEPGSVMKLATLIALLEDGHARLDTPLDIPGDWFYGKGHTRFSDTKAGGWGSTTLVSAFAQSSNVAFAQLAVRHYENNPEAFLGRLHTLMPLDSIGLEFGAEAHSLIPSPDGNLWGEATLPMIANGYSVMFTPLQILTLYNAVAAGGKMVKPHLIEALCRDGKEIETIAPQVLNQNICSPATVADVQAALRSVVTDGTGQFCDDEGLNISGKTGTSQMAFEEGGRMVYKDADGNRKMQCTFAGYFPSESPKYSCIVVLYSAKTRGIIFGGNCATLVFKEIADRMFFCTKLI